MNLLTKINHIPLKYVIGMNLAILVLAVTFMSVNTVNITTENRPQAAETPLPSPLTQILVDPTNPPTLLSPDPDWAKVGDAILIKGKNLGTVPFGTLTLGDLKIPHSNIVEWTNDHLVFTVPEGAITASVGLAFSDESGQPYVLSSTIPLTITSTNRF